MKAKAELARQIKPSKGFVKEMERMYPKGATITPTKKTSSRPVSKGKK